MSTHDNTPENLYEQQSKVNELNPAFEIERYGIGAEEIMLEADNKVKSLAPIPHKQILNLLLDKVEKIDFMKMAFPEAEDTEQTNLKISRKHIIVITIDEILETAKRYHCQLCRNNGQTYLYNGVYWKAIDPELLQGFFGEAAAKMGVPITDTRYYIMRRELIYQFESIAYLTAPERNTKITLINLLNGTFEVSAEKQVLRVPSADDFITYQLPFEYKEEATAAMFYEYLNKVLPDKEAQAVLQEFLGYVFISPQTLKLEKVLLLYGSGANGKSVLIDIINTLLGRENVSSYSLQTLTDPKAYTRAELATKLLNCASEINGKMESSEFKLLASGEPIEARHIFGRPFIMEHYAKLMFSTNELPKEVEQTNGYFRRWIILPFTVTIPEEEQDKQLAKKIINSELSGVFNWVLEGLKRLLKNKRFSDCTSATKQLEDFKTQSDSVLLFISDEGYHKSLNARMPLKELFSNYKNYCHQNNYRECSNRTFIDRLRNSGFETKRETAGNVIFIEK